MPERKESNLPAARAKVRIVADAQSAGPLLHRSDNGTFNLAFAPGFDNSRSGTPGLPAGLAGAKMSHQGVMQSFPDRTQEILDVIADGDRVFVRSRVRGTNTLG